MILVTGNPITGFTYYGPFVDGATAITWAENHIGNEHYWTAPLVPVT